MGNRRPQSQFLMQCFRFNQSASFSWLSNEVIFYLMGFNLHHLYKVCNIASQRSDSQKAIFPHLYVGFLQLQFSGRDPIWTSSLSATQAPCAILTGVSISPRGVGIGGGTKKIVLIFYIKNRYIYMQHINSCIVYLWHQNFMWKKVLRKKIKHEANVLNRLQNTGLTIQKRGRSEWEQGYDTPFFSFPTEPREGSQKGPPLGSCLT
jgi:hypothetical protein